VVCQQRLVPVSRQLYGSGRVVNLVIIRERAWLCVAREASIIQCISQSRHGECASNSRLTRGSLRQPPGPTTATVVWERQSLSRRDTDRRRHWRCTVPSATATGHLASRPPSRVPSSPRQTTSATPRHRDVQVQLLGDLQWSTGPTADETTPMPSRRIPTSPSSPSPFRTRRTRCVH